MLYLFTTTYRHLFKRDLLNVCCKNEGEIIRFGYSKKYIDPTILKENQSIINRQALVVFLEYRGKEYIPHPIRQVTIKGFEPNSDVDHSATVDIELGNYFDYSDSDEQIASTLENFNQFFSAIEDHPKPKEMFKSGNSYFFLEADHVFNSITPKMALQCSNSIQWIRLYKHLKKINSLENLIFFRQVEDMDKKNPFIKLDLSDKNTKPAPNQIQMRSGQNYRVVFEVIFGDKEAIPIFLKSDSINIFGPYQKQKNDSIIESTYIISTPRSYQRSNSMLSIKVEPNEKSLGPISPEYSALIKLRPNRLLLWITIGLLILGNAMTNKDVNDFLVVIFQSEDIKKAFKAISYLIGYAFLAIGFFLGFNRLPIK